MLTSELASCGGIDMRDQRIPVVEDALDLDLLAERRAQQLGDVEHGRVDVDVARLQRLLAGESQQMADQLGAAVGGPADQDGELGRRAAGP